MKVIQVTSQKKKDYLADNGIYPVEELYNGVSFYWYNREYKKAVLRYKIENYYIKNKLD